MAREWSKKIARSNVGSDPFEKAVGESLQVIFKSNAGSAPKLYLEMPTTRWILEGDAGKKTVKVRGNDRSPMKMDAFTVFGNSHILRDRWNHKTSAVVNFEFTTTQPNHLVDYMVGKINYLSGIVDAHSRARTFRGLAYAVSGAATYRETIRNIRANNNHPRGRHEDIDHSLLDSINPRSSIKTMLIFITNNEEKVGTAGTLSAKLGGPAVWGAAPPVTPVRSGGSDVKGAFDVVTPSGETIRIGQININQLLDIVTTIEALEGSEARFRKNITDRFFWDITRFSFGEDGALTMSDTRQRRLKESAGEIEDFREAGTQSFTVGPTRGRVTISADVYQFRIKQDLLVDLTHVDRTMNKAESLQRTAAKNHLKGMAISIQSEKRFHIPVILIADDDTDFDLGGGARRGLYGNQPILKPYGWRIIDGQHRVFSCYHKEVGAVANDFELDVLMFKFTGGATADQIGEAGGEIFYDVNYRGVEPPTEVALNHLARMAKFPFGLEKKGTGWGKNKQAYSSRIHAMRFLQELNDNSRIFADKFDLFNLGRREGGVLDRKLLKPASITTYFAPHFEFGHRSREAPFWFNAKKSLMWTYGNSVKFGGGRAYFHRVPDGAGALVPWGTVGAVIPNPSPAHRYGVPTPDELQAAGFYRRLRKDFDDFCDRIRIRHRGHGGPAVGPTEAVRGWCMDEAISSSFLPALFRVFVRYYCEAEPGAVLAFANLPLTPGRQIQRIGQAIDALVMPHLPIAGGRAFKWPGGEGAVRFFEKEIVHSYNNRGAVRRLPAGLNRIPV